MAKWIGTLSGSDRTQKAVLDKASKIEGLPLASRHFPEVYYALMWLYTQHFSNSVFLLLMGNTLGATAKWTFFEVKPQPQNLNCLYNLYMCLFERKLLKVNHFSTLLDI